jgi:outer membrane protein assembly factor BamB
MRKTAGQIDSSPAPAGGIAYIGSVDSNLYAFKAKTGKQVWSYTTGGSIYSTPSVSDGAVNVGTLNSNFCAVDANTGTKLWMAKTDGDLWGSLAVADRVAYVISGGKGKYKCDASKATNGDLLWSTRAFSGEPGSPPTVANGVVYFGSKNGNVYALDASAGSRLWTYLTNDQVIASPAVVNGRAYVGSYDGSLYVFGLTKRG